MSSDEPPGGGSDTTESRWSRIDAVFSALLDLPAEARDAAVDRYCAGDGVLAAAVRRLLTAERRSDRVFEAAAASVQAMAEHAVAPLADDDALPESLHQIGAYRLTERLGAGGMSVVWKAQRNDGEFQQNVAVKLLRRWIDGDEMVQRFREERRILASLEHPNLARLLDGGVAGEGWPYFIMEYVDGVPITDYCDAGRLTVGQRLALLGQVLDVVQYAHRRLVVHRDLKPSNILVTRDGQVKLLDFGIAKVLDSERTAAGASDLTQVGGRPLTPAYASPEQITGEPISTATDVYAIGVLLYQLMTGASPDRVPADQPMRLHDAVLNQTPQNPSARVLHSGAGDVELARLRGTTPGRLGRALRGDLDVICQVALRKEPDRRYATVEQLAADLDRHRQQRPVLARAGNWRYLAGRFARRHAWALAAGILIPTAALTGLALHAERYNRAALAELGDDNLLSRAPVLTNLDIVAILTSRYDEATGLLEQAGAAHLRLGLFGETHELVGNALRHLAELYWNRGDIDRAMDYGRRSVDVLGRVFGGDRPEVIELAAWLAALSSGHLTAPPPLPSMGF
jgi:eukaryotic-like serine/threonine-protein kinase